MSIDPYYDDGALCLYNEDMNNVVSMLNDNSVDLVLTDPPYGIEYRSNHRASKFGNIDNDDKLYMDLDLYWSKIRDTGSLWSFYSHKIELVDNKDYEYRYKLLLSQIVSFQQELYCSSSKVDFIQSIMNIIHEHDKYNKKNHISRIKNKIIWVKNNWTAGDLKGDFGNQYECIAFCPKKEFEIRGHRHSNIWKFDRVPPSNHPTEKPISLLSRIIESSTDVGDLVFDPFCGSGATMFACKKLNRRFVGAEIDPGHCDCIVNDYRLKQGGLGI